MHLQSDNLLFVTWTNNFCSKIVLQKNLFDFSVLWCDFLWSFLIKINQEASYFDRINMTKNGLEYDRKKFTPMNMNVGTWLKDYTDES